MTVTMAHGGDLGDCLAALPVLRRLGGGDFVLTGTDKTRERMTPERANLLIPLLVQQPYVKSARFEASPQGVTHDLANFRTTRPQPLETLTAWQARHLGISDVDTSPWLTVKPSLNARGMAVFARSFRYHNSAFNWKAIWDKVEKAVFMGTGDEAKDFIETFRPILRAQTSNLLEAAQLIAGSKLFVGNQSCPCWLAMALGHPMVQETCPIVVQQNSIIPRDNATFIRNEGDMLAWLEGPKPTSNGHIRTMIGDGKKPNGYDGWSESRTWNELLRLDGSAEIHLYSGWQRVVSPERLHEVLMTIQTRTGKQPKVTLST